MARIKNVELEKKEVVVIDKNADAIRRVSDNLDVQVIQGSGSSPVVLEEAGIRNAEMQDTKQEKKEAKESFSEEMEQHVSAEIDPGRDIAKAYRLLREKKWRLAMIYLNHLAKKYPNWDSVYMVKAIAHYILHEPVFMKQALNEACRLANQTVCDDLKN